MERSEGLDAMGKLKLYGMSTSYDEISENQARSIKYQMTIAKRPLAKELPSHGLLCKPLPGDRDVQLRSNRDQRDSDPRPGQR